MNPLSAVYGQVARVRRHWYEQRPHRQRQLGCPVISVGNLVVGGSGKTPVVAMLAELLRNEGYSPAVLSRGYRRRRSGPDVVIVSDGHRVVADVERSGDEPQLLARRLPSVPVVVATKRYDAGVVARDRFGADVLILDDGFQHFEVARTVDLLLLSPDDEKDSLLPGGRLREPLHVAAAADALLVPAGLADPLEFAGRVGVAHAFEVRTVYQSLRSVKPYDEPVVKIPRRVVTLAAIARPERFVAGVRDLGYSVEQQIAFRDHHWFTPADIQRAEQTARAVGAEAILTTEKDAVRLEPVVTGTLPVVFLPIDARVEPADAFRSWLLSRLAPTGTRG